MRSEKATRLNFRGFINLNAPIQALKGNVMQPFEAALKVNRHDADNTITRKQNEKTPHR